MVKKLFSLSIVAGAGVVSACFGSGPTPSQPSRATVLFTGQPIENCGTGTYIGPVALGSASGYVTLLPFVQQGGQSGNCGGGGQVPNQAEDVLAFDEDGGSLMMIGSAGYSSQGIHDQILATGSGAVYAYSEMSMMGTWTYVDPGRIKVGSGMGIDSPVGIAMSGSDVYVEIVSNQNTTGQAEPDNPEYPCCGGGTPGVQGSIWKVGATSAMLQVNPVCTTTDRCFAGNSTSLVYFERPNTTSNELWRLTSTATGMIASSTSGMDMPVGLDADDTTIAFTTSPACTSMGNNNFCNVDDCTVYAYDLATMHLTTLLSTQSWGCMDAKLAGGYVYFTIIGWSERTQHIFGKGIGRVSLADHTFESLDLGIQGDAAGPRRIFPSGDRLYLVDPLVMARIDAADLAGKHDFTP